MSYTATDFLTKKALKQATFGLHSSDPVAVAAAKRALRIKPTSVVGDDPKNGQAVIEGPQYPKPHRWYATVRVEDGIVVEVLS